MAMAVSYTIGDLLARWTNETPKQPSPSEPVLLVEPDYFDTVRMAGIAIVKALYGRGKTYGFGYNLYHTARIKRDQEVIYINAREVRDRLTSIGSTEDQGKTLKLHNLLLLGDALDIVRLICIGYYLPQIVNTNEGIYLATNTDLLKKICPNISNYLSKGLPIGLREFLRDIAKASPRRLVIIIDEFEQLTSTTGGRPNVEYVYNLIDQLLISLRPGVLDEQPGKFGIVLLIQELYYPTDRMRKLVAESSYPAIGRMFSVSDDGSIPVHYSIEAYMKYIENAIRGLVVNNYINQKIADLALQAFRDSNIRRLLREYLPNMPALIAFNILQQLLITALSLPNVTPDVIKSEFENFMESYMAYAIYGGKRDVAKGKYLANALAGLLEDYYGGDTIATTIERVGFEGAYVFTNNGIKILVSRLSDVDDMRSYLNEFKRLYGNILKTYCAQQTQKKGQPPPQPSCELTFITLEDVKVGNANAAINTLLRSGIDGVPVSFTYKLKKITYDDLFILITRYNNDIAVLTGDRRYVNSPDRLQSLRNKIFG